MTAIVKIAMRAGAAVSAPSSAAASAAASVPPPAVPTTAPVRTGIGFYQQQQAPTTAPMAGAKRPAQYDAPTTAPADKRSRVGEGGAAVGTAGGYAAAVAAADAAADAGAQYGADAAVRGEELRRELDPLSSVDLEAESRAPEIVPREGGAVDEAARFGSGERAAVLQRKLSGIAARFGLQVRGSLIASDGSLIAYDCVPHLGLQVRGPLVASDGR